MKNLLLLLMLLVATNNYSQVEIDQPPTKTETQTQSIYSIGTGISLNYFTDRVNFNIDSLHIFRSLKRPFDYALLKAGMGVDYNLDT